MAIAAATHSLTCTVMSRFVGASQRSTKLKVIVLPERPSGPMFVVISVVESLSKPFFSASY